MVYGFKSFTTKIVFIGFVQSLIEFYCINSFLHGIACGVQQVLAVLTGIPAFQFRQNIDTLYPHYKFVSPRVALWVAVARSPFTSVLILLYFHLFGTRPHAEHLTHRRLYRQQ